METQDFYDHLATLREQDPDYIVDVLDISSDELLMAFGVKAANFIEEEYG